jgi:hypothetical protein
MLERFQAKGLRSIAVSFSKIKSGDTTSRVRNYEAIADPKPEIEWMFSALAPSTA